MDVELVRVGDARFGKTRPRLLPQPAIRHRRAFEMPARPARRLDAGGRRPTWLATFPLPGRFAPRLLFRRFPQDEIGGVLLVGRDLDPGAGDHLVERAI